jgi:hypothetical protein
MLSSDISRGLSKVQYLLGLIENQAKSESDLSAIREPHPSAVIGE